MSAAVPPAKRYRVPITAIAVAGLGALVALAVGVSLFLGLSSATENTRRLMALQSEMLVDAIDQRLEAELQPVVRQALWMVEQIEKGHVGLDDAPALDAFMLAALGATPRVTAIGIVDPQAQVLGWERASRQRIREDWSGQPDAASWLEDVAARTGAFWQPPIWTPVLEETVVHHDVPIRIDGEFAGIFSQAVSVSDLSRHLASLGAETGIIPFILYDHDHVLAHPLLMGWTPDTSERDQPLVALDALGDAVLERIWSPDDPELFLLEDMTETSGSGTIVGDDYYVFLYRDLLRYGPAPWTIGAYVNTGTSDVFEWLAEIFRSIVTGAYHDGVPEGEEFERLVAATLVGLAVFVVSVGLAAWLGTRASRPVKAIAAAARSVESQRLDRVDELPPSRVAEFDDANRSFNRMVAGLQERELIRETLGRFVPSDIARALLSEGGELAPEQSEATVLFCDLVSFTSLTETLGPEGIVLLLNEYFEAMVEILERRRGVVTQFQGDAILATFNVPLADPDHAANALRAAIEMQSAVRRRDFAGRRIANRIGVNTGPVVAGAVGAKGRLSYTVHGDAVNLAARLEALNKELGTTILVSRTTAARVEGFDLRPRGEVGAPASAARASASRSTRSVLARVSTVRRVDASPARSIDASPASAPAPGPREGSKRYRMRILSRGAT